MTIRLTTLGAPSCFVGDEELTDLPSQKARFALLVYVAIQGNASRDEVTALFWPESDDEHARHALSQAIYELKRQLGDTWLLTHAGRLSVSSDVTIDAHEFTKLVQAGSFAEAVRLYRGPFLDGFFLSNSKGFESWLERQRAQYERAHRRARREHLNQLLETNQAGAAVEAARRWVELDPFEDEANHRLIELLAASGQRAEALREFNAYELRLRAELAIEPLENTKQLVEALRKESGLGGTVLQSAPAARFTLEPLPAGNVAEGPGDRLPDVARRRVWRIAVWYGASVFGLIQFTQTMLDAFYLPPWVLTATAVIAIAGFPVVVLLSWRFDITAQGLRRATPPPATFTQRKSWRLIAFAFTVIVVVAGVALLFPVSRSMFAFGRSPGLVCEDGSPAPCRSGVAIDPNRIAVLPLQHRYGTTAGTLPGDIAADILMSSLSAWQDILPVSQVQVTEQLRSRSVAVAGEVPLDTACAIARAVGAGKVIVGYTAAIGDTTIISTSLFNALTGVELERAAERFATIDARPEAVLRKLAARLVLQDADSQVSEEVAGKATNSAAVMSLDSALRALNRRDLAAAELHYRSALERDPAFTHARLGLAHLMLWRGDTSAEWRVQARHAGDGADKLSGTARLLAVALAGLADRRFREACGLYRQVIEKDAQNFEAWYGLSECLARDPTVVRDAASPSGWSFATSYHEAVQAHIRALQLVPSLNESFRNLASWRLSSLLYTTTGKHRVGIVDGGTPMRFASFPAVEADTISFVPYPMAEWATRPTPPTRWAAIERHRRELKHAALLWARAYPDNPRALEALSLALELTGAIAPAKSSDRSALDALRRAQSLEPDGVATLRLRAAEVRMLVKIGRLREARRKAHALLAKHKNPDPAEARRLAGLAGLVGEPHRMAQLLVATAPEFEIDRPVTGEHVEPPPVLARAAAALLAYAYFGVPPDSLRPLAQRAHAALDNYVPPEERELVHSAVLDRAALILFPVLGADDAHATERPGWPFLAIQSAVARGDTSEARRRLAWLDSLRANLAPIENSADGVLIKTRLLLALHDTAAAKQTLDEYLNDLGNVAPAHFNQPYQPVAIVQMMILRAELATLSGERAAARRWARAVVDLWQDGSNEVKPTVKKMRSLARS